MSDERSQSTDKQEAIFKRRLLELASRSYGKAIYTFTDFLNASECLYALSCREIAYAGVTAYGGMEHCERVMIRFGSEQELGYEMPFPIAAVHTKCTAGDFARELTHRDYLGALMNLGIERPCIGDILVMKNEAYILCVSRMAKYICESLDKVSREPISCEIIWDVSLLPDSVGPSFERKNASVSSLRVDAVVAAVYSISRSASLDLVESGCVYVDQKECLSPSKELCEGCRVSVRGKGKFIFIGVDHVSKKGRSNISVDIYV